MSLNGGYAMIKYNSTQEELQIAYRSKKPVLFYDENQRAHWAVIEETATQSVDEETQEPITLYEYSYKLLDEASNVVANPTLSGDEATLNGLDIDGTKYKVGGGSAVHLYAHYIHMKMDTTLNINLVIYKNDNIQFTYSTIISWLSSNGFSYTNDNFYNANGYYYNGSRIVLGVAPGGQGYFRLFYEYIKDGSLTYMLGEALGDGFTITDHITQIF